MSGRHFLAPLLKAGGGRYVLANAETGVILASTIELAQDSRSRTRGLLGRTGLDQGAVMIIAPCNAVHTFFMRFTIDVVFADRQGRVVKICRRLRPWRVGISVGGFAALEFSESAIERSGLKIGDRLMVRAQESQ